jgi:hypothetical protein
VAFSQYPKAEWGSHDVWKTIRGRWIVSVGVIDAAAAIAAVMDGKVTNLLIAAGMVASNAAILGVMVDRRLGDAYDSGSRARARVLARHGQD